MSVQIIWDNDEKTILRQVYAGRWTADDFLHGFEKTYKLLNGLDQIVHIILDLTETEKVPSNILSIMRDLDTYIADNQGKLVIVGITPFFDTVLAVAHKLAPKASANWCAAENLERARSIIEHDAGFLKVI